MIRKLLSLLLILALTLSLTACGKKEQDPGPAGDDPFVVVPPQGEPAAVAENRQADQAVRFAVEMFRRCHEAGGNTLVSPLSVMAALALAANGARGETLRQMEEVLGMTAEEMSVFFRDLMASLAQSEENDLFLANSMWLNAAGDLVVDEEFVKKNTELLGAEVLRKKFNEALRKEINGWVEKNTDGMIPEILDRIDPDAVMYLINALVFEAEWERIYSEYEVQEGPFTTASGRETTVEYMHCEEYAYLNDGRAQGFLKYYQGREYAFAALLPEEGVSLEEYVASLDGAALRALLAGAEHTEVLTSIPKFETDSGFELSEVLKKMGMPLAFDEDDADFSGMGDAGGRNLYIGRVIHKTRIRVDERGTKAGAATLVEMRQTAVLDRPEPKEVYLDRPFVYMLIETGSFTPFFIGCVSDIGE